jgi:hypothetical protein
MERIVERFFNCSPTRRTVPAGIVEVVTLFVDDAVVVGLAEVLVPQAESSAPDTARATKADLMGAVLALIPTI